MTETTITTDTAQSRGGNARKEKLSKQRRSEIAREAAASRWGKKPEPIKVAPKRAARKAPAKMKKPARCRSARSNGTAWRQFNAALITAEKRLIEANAERVEAWTNFCNLSNEIPNLENTVSSLRALQATLGQVAVKQPNAPFDLAAILAGQFPAPAVMVPAPTPAPYVPPMPVVAPVMPVSGYVPPSMAQNPSNLPAPAPGDPVKLPAPENNGHAVPVLSRASGFALGTTPQIADSEDENQFLTGPMAGRDGWH